MRPLVLATLLAIAACDPVAESPLRQVSIESPAALSLSLREVPARALRAMGLSYGLSVIRAGRLAERAGLRVGDVVYAVNDQRIGSLEQFTRIVAARPGQLGLLVRRGATDYYVPVEMNAEAPLPRLPGKRELPRDTLLRT